MTNNNGDRLWRITREKILMTAGLLLIFIVLALVAASAVSAEAASQFVLAGLALCGISIAQWGDRKNGS